MALRAGELGVDLRLDVGAATFSGTTACFLRIRKPDFTKVDVDLLTQAQSAGNGQILTWTLPAGHPFQTEGRYYLQLFVSKTAAVELLSQVIPFQVEERLYLAVAS